MSAGADPAAAARLCTACGMCCNGVMFHMVRLQPRDSPKELAAIGMKLKRRNKHHYILQPCPAHRGSQCSIYHERPERCRLFECRQLKRVASGEVTEAAALAKIQDVQRRVAHLNVLLQQGGGTDPRRPLSKRYEKIMTDLLTGSDHDESAGLRAELTQAMHELDVILDEEFRLPAQELAKEENVAATEGSPRLIAAYGTLMRGQEGQNLAGIQGCLTYIGPCTLRGTLYDLGEYPGMIEGDGTVEAELYELRDDATLAQLDAYEGFEEGNPNALFVRRRVRLPGSEEDCWVYFFNRSVATSRQIPGGNWAQYLRGRSGAPLL